MQVLHHDGILRIGLQGDISDLICFFDSGRQMQKAINESD